MAYPEKLLADDEQVVEHLHPHWITLVPATLWFIVICAVAGVGIAFAPDSGTSRTVVLILIIVVGLGLLSWLSFKPWMSVRTSHYVFTTHRVLIRHRPAAPHRSRHRAAAHHRRRFHPVAARPHGRCRHADDRVGQ